GREPHAPPSGSPSPALAAAVTGESPLPESGTTPPHAHVEVPLRGSLRNQWNPSFGLGRHANRRGQLRRMDSLGRRRRHARPSGPLRALQSAASRHLSPRLLVPVP